MKKFINKIDFDFYIRCVHRVLSHADKLYLMSKNDTV
jgi:hypothetical protein